MYEALWLEFQNVLPRELGRAKAAQGKAQGRLLGLSAITSDIRGPRNGKWPNS